MTILEAAISDTLDEIEDGLEGVEKRLKAGQSHGLPMAWREFKELEGRLAAIKAVIRERVLP